MTPRPGRISDVIDVPFERPRGAEMAKEPEFQELVFRAHAGLHGTGATTTSRRKGARMGLKPSPLRGAQPGGDAAGGLPCAPGPDLEGGALERLGVGHRPPHPEDVVDSFLDLVFSDIIWDDIAATLWESVAGFTWGR